MGDPLVLHAALLAELDRPRLPSDDCSCSSCAGRSAVRAVVELHKPTVLGIYGTLGRIRDEIFCPVCADEDDPYSGIGAWPCDTIKVVAEGLGVHLD